MQLAGVELSGALPEVSGGVVDCYTTEQITSAPSLNDLNIGLPNGIFKEAAVQLVTAAMGKKTHQEKEKGISEGLACCIRSGLTAVQTNDESSLLVYKSLQQQQFLWEESRQDRNSKDVNCESPPLPLRVFLTPTYEDLRVAECEGGLQGVDPHPFPRLLDEKDLSKAESRLFWDRIKIFSDGSLGAQTAAIRVFSDASDSIKEYSGVLVHPYDELIAMCIDSFKLNYRLEVHAIGDAAADHVMRAIENAILHHRRSVDNTTVPSIDPTLRPVLTHCQILGRDIIERMVSCGAIANVQPSFVPTDMRYFISPSDSAKNNNLSVEQLQHSYIWKTLLSRGVTVAGGSDSPIECPSPFQGMYDAMFRTNKQRLKADEEEIIFLPDERLNFSEALWLYTIGAARAMNAEHALGQLRPGYSADLVIVPIAVFDNPEVYLPKVVVETPSIVIVGGETMYSADGRGLPAVGRGGDYLPGKAGNPSKILSSTEKITPTWKSIKLSTNMDEDVNGLVLSCVTCLLTGRLKCASIPVPAYCLQATDYN